MEGLSNSVENMDISLNTGLHPNMAPYYLNDFE